MMLDKIALQRDILIRNKKCNPDIPANYYDGVLDLYNDVRKILEEEDEGKRISNTK